jgi:hypothetical protein
MMRAWEAGILALALAGAATRTCAQITGGAPTDSVLLSAQFRTPLTYEAALARLDEYYQEQVGRKLAIALPEIAPRQRYDVWHDIWVTFGPDADKMLVTMTRPADSITSRLVKTWMLALAGRLNGEIPLVYKDQPALSSADAEIYATPRDVAAALSAQPALKPLPSWQHAGLMVSASPLANVVVSSAGLHGVRHLTVTAQSAAAARQLLATVVQGSQKPCICAVYSEAAELDAEILKEAQERSAKLGADTAGAIYIPQSNLKHHEDRVRAEPEMQKRIAAAVGHYGVRYRIDKPYREVTLTWTELADYSREDGKFKGERTVGRTVIPNPRSVGPGAQNSVRARVEPLQPGAYRLRLDGTAAPGQSARIDERIYWFDGKTFEEL